MQRLLLAATSVALMSHVSARGNFNDAETVFRSSPEALTTQQFEAGIQGLNKSFDRLCGDTFCEGDYANLTPISFVCSIDESTKKVGHCIWSFAGSSATINPADGTIETSRRNIDCDVGFVGSVVDLARLLRNAAATSQSDLTEMKVPGAGHSLYDALEACF